MKKFFFSVLKSMWAAWIWLIAIIADIVMFSGATPTNKAALLFDQLVMLSCFLMYPVNELGRHDGIHGVIPFVIQFIFWWFFGILFVVSYRIGSRKKVKK